MPKCAWLLIATLTLLLHHSIGIAATINAALTATVWAATTPAALIAIAALAFWHLANHHQPTPARART